LRRRKDAAALEAHTHAMSRRPPALAVLERPLSEVLASLPAKEVCRAGLHACVGCAVAPFETVGEAVRLLKLDAPKVARALSAALARKGRP